MPDNFKKEDLRIKKTYKALVNAMIVILSRRNFNRITVNDLCEEALISRATFYVHFKDKYDLLKYCLLDVRKDIIKNIYDYQQLEILINKFMHENQKIITNILKDANSETLGLIEDLISSIIDIFIKRNVGNAIEDINYTILSNFCTGGIVNLLSMQVKKQFQSDINMMNSYLYEMLKHIIEWDKNLPKK